MEEIATIITGDFITPAFAHSLRKEGRYGDARAVINMGLCALPPEAVEDRLAFAIELSKVEQVEGNFGRAADVLLEASPLAELCGSDELRAKFHHTLAAAYQLNGETNKALIEYAGASGYFDKAGKPYDAGCVENNVALIQMSLGRVEEAREHVRRAKAHFTNHPVKSAEVEETEAQICLADSDAFNALRLVTRACAVFAEHGEAELLRKAMPTLLKAGADYQAQAYAGMREGK